MVVEHLPGVLNGAADAHSCNRCSDFFSHSSGSQVAGGPVRRSHRACSGATSRLDLQRLDGSAGALFVRGLSENSRSAYSAGKRRYLSFCSEAGITPLPPTELTLCRFVAYLDSEGLRAQSISGYLSAVRQLSIEAGLSPLSREVCPQLQYILRGVGRSQAAQRTPLRLPITPSILLALKSAWESGIVDVPIARLLWAMSVTAFFGCFRIGELMVQNPASPPAIRVSDVSFEQSPALLRFSKTDPGGSGVSVVLGATGGALCPVQALANYLAVRSGSPGPLFIWPDGRPVSREGFVALVRAALSSSGMDPVRYSGHSFRIGAATAAAQARVPSHLIKAMGRWGSDAYMMYIRTPPKTLAALAGQISGSVPPAWG